MRVSRTAGRDGWEVAGRRGRQARPLLARTSRDALEDAGQAEATLSVLASSSSSSLSSFLARHKQDNYNPADVINHALSPAFGLWRQGALQRRRPPHRAGYVHSIHIVFAHATKDLVYVTDRIIVMGFPAVGVESVYRNRRADVQRFLSARHGSDFWVFNFCPVRENAYDESVFEHRISRYPFPDHQSVPLSLWKHHTHCSP